MKKFDPTLTPTQRAMKTRPRKVSYNPEHRDKRKNYVDPEMARYIIVLYICGLGYSPIRHIVGLDNDKKVEDVVRQHMLGRNNVNSPIEYEGKMYEFNSELICPGRKSLDELTTRIVKKAVNRYGTIKDDYVYKMLHEGRWHDDPVTSDYNKCKKCGKEIDASEGKGYCPYCGTQFKISRPKMLFKEVG